MNMTPLCEIKLNRPRLGVYIAYDLPSVAALVWYFHADAGYPVRSAWLNATKAGNYAFLLGITYNNASWY